LTSGLLAQVTSSGLKGMELNGQKVGQAALAGLTQLRVLRMEAGAITKGCLSAILPRACVLSTLSLSLPHLRWLQLDHVELGRRLVILQVALLVP
jgi:hypothetical protein